jgi:16S rRNA (adenine1518-N6/adenine1519-N6)-dimethyltransferase
MTSPRNILGAYDMHAKKQLGQNFLCDKAVPEMIVEKSGLGPEATVFEIGAGLGALTIAAAKRAKKVYALERDRSLVPLLKTELLAAGVDEKVEVIEGDILRADLKTVTKGHSGKVRVMGNLPYNISSQIIIWLVKSRSLVDKGVFMLQKEMADRVAAPPGSKDYGRLSAVVQYCADVRKLASIGASQFFPRPKVDSEVIEISFEGKPVRPALDEDFLFSVIKAAFGQRRKNLKNSLTGGQLGVDGSGIMEALEKAGIDHQRRAETLTVAEFVILSDILLPFRQD